MNSKEDTGTQAIFASKHDALVHRLLRIGLTGSGRPVDELIERLTRSGGKEWLDRTLKAEPFAGDSATAEQIKAGSASLEALSALKSASKKFAKGDDEDRHRAMLAYFLAVAGAKAAYGKMLSSRPATEVGPILADLGAALPDELGAVCNMAAEAMRG